MLFKYYNDFENVSRIYAQSLYYRWIIIFHNHFRANSIVYSLEYISDSAMIRVFSARKNCTGITKPLIVLQFSPCFLDKGYCNHLEWLWQFSTRAYNVTQMSTQSSGNFASKAQLAMKIIICTRSKSLLIYRFPGRETAALISLDWNDYLIMP